MKKLGKVLAVILEIVIIAYVIAITTCLLCKNKFGYTKFGSDTLVIIDNNNSAEFNEFKKGDLVILTEVKYDKIKEGDSIYYYDVVNNEYVIKKNNVKSKNGDNGAYLYTLEDSNTITRDRVVGVYSGKTYKNFGSILDVLESRIGFLLIVILPIFVLFIYQVYKMVILLKFNNEEEKD